MKMLAQFPLLLDNQMPDFMDPRNPRKRHRTNPRKEEGGGPHATAKRTLGGLAELWQADQLALSPPDTSYDKAHANRAG